MMRNILKGGKRRYTMTHALCVMVISLCATVFALCALASSSRAATYYADAIKGSDSNSGTSLSTALKTIQKAADVMTAGDSCLVQPGDYDERVNINKSGTSSSPISFAAVGSVLTRGFKVYADYINISGFEMTLNGVSLHGKYCQILNNHIHDLDFVGVDLITDLTYSDNATVSHCIVKGNTISYAVKCGIRIMGQNHLIENNDISHTLRCSPFSDYCDDADGIRFFGSGHIIRKNYIHDILQQPENHDDPHIDFFQTWRTAYDIVFEQNLCISRNTSGSNQIVMVEEFEGETVKNLIFRNNIFVMGAPGYCEANFHQHRSGDWIENITIVNNIFFHKNLSEIGKYAIRLIRIKNATVQNNVFYDFGDSRSNKNYVDIENSENFEIGYNCVYISTGQSPAGGPYPNDLWMVNPEFLNVEEMDFHYNKSSPLIDNGIFIQGVKNDLDENPRPQGSSFDIGAFEYIASDLLPPKDLRIIK